MEKIMTLVSILDSGVIGIARILMGPRRRFESCLSTSYYILA